MRLLAAISFAGFLTALNVHLLCFTGAHYQRIVAWHWPLGIGTFLALTMLSLLLGAMGHETRYRGMSYTPLIVARYEYDEGLFIWPAWAKRIVVAVSLYSALAFVVFFWYGPDIARVGGEYLQYGASNPVPLTLEEYDALRVGLQRGLTALHLPFYLAVAVTALFVEPPSRETPSRSRRP